MARKVRPWRGVGLGINRKQSGQVKEDALLPGTIADDLWPFYKFAWPFLILGSLRARWLHRSLCSPAMTLLRSPCDAVASKPRALQTAKRIPTGLTFRFHLFWRLSCPLPRDATLLPHHRRRPLQIAKSSSHTLWI